MNIALWYEKLLFLVFEHYVKQVCNKTRFSEENFAFAILYELLYVERHLLGDEEVLHVFGQCDAHVLAQVEEVGYGLFGVENNCGVA